MTPARNFATLSPGSPVMLRSARTMVRRVGALGLFQTSFSSVEPCLSFTHFHLHFSFTATGSSQDIAYSSLSPSQISALRLPLTHKKNHSFNCLHHVYITVPKKDHRQKHVSYIIVYRHSQNLTVILSSIFIPQGIKRDPQPNQLFLTPFPVPHISSMTLSSILTRRTGSFWHTLDDRGLHRRRSLL